MYVIRDVYTQIEFLSGHLIWLNSYGVRVRQIYLNTIFNIEKKGMDTSNHYGLFGSFKSATDKQSDNISYCILK